MSGAAAGVCVLTNQSRMGIPDAWALQRQELEQSISDSGHEKLMCLMSIKTCKLILVVTLNRIMNIKISKIWVLQPWLNLNQRSFKREPDD